MDASVVRFSQPPARLPPEFEPDMEKIKRRLLKYGVDPTPKILKNLRKKEIQKHNRRTKRQTESEGETVYTEAQRQSMEEEARFETLKREYKQFTRTVSGDRSGGERSLIVGNPWEGIERVRLKELVGGVRREDLSDGKTRRENLKELKKILEQDLRWVLEDDVDDVEEEYSLVAARNDDVGFDPAKRWRNEGEAVRVLVDRYLIIFSKAFD